MQRVADIMTRSVRVARPDGAMVDLVEAFSDGGLHHMPVLDDDERVVGMITQSDVVAALFMTREAAGVGGREGRVLRFRAPAARAQRSAS